MRAFIKLQFHRVKKEHKDSPVSQWKWCGFLWSGLKCHMSPFPHYWFQKETRFKGRAHKPYLFKGNQRIVVVVQLLSHVWLFTTTWTAACQASLSFAIFLHYVEYIYTQTHVHWVSDAIQPSHPLLPPSPPALSLLQHQDLFQWVGSLHQIVKVLGFQN